MVAHAVRLDASGQLRVAREAPPEDPEKLRRTAAALRAAAGAGAVEVVDLRDDGTRVELVVAYAGRPVAGPLPARDVARFGAALARSLAMLHARGIAHGALRAEHVLVDAGGVVRLCGFVGGDGPGDVRDFGALLLSLLDDRDHGEILEVVRATATRCIVDDASARPTMDAVAINLAAVGLSPAVDDQRATPRTRRRLASIAMATLAVVLAFAVVRARPPHGTTVSPATTTTTTTTTSDASTTTTTTAAVARVWPRSPRQIDGAGATWELASAAGDHVVLGDWDCDATATPAIVRASGDVFVVDDFPSAEEIRARYVTTIPDAVGANVARRDGCDHLEVTTERGRITVSLDRAPAA